MRVTIDRVPLPSRPFPARVRGGVIAVHSVGRRLRDSGHFARQSRGTTRSYASACTWHALCEPFVRLNDRLGATTPSLRVAEVTDRPTPSDVRRVAIPNPTRKERRRNNDATS